MAKYGGVELGGLSVGMLISTEEGVMFGPDTAWDVVLLVDEAAADDRRAAVEEIFLGRAGGIWAAVADTHVRSAEVATVPMDYSRDGSEFAVTIGTTGRASAGRRGRASGSASSAWAVAGRCSPSWRSPAR
jgi:hypothetical protein